MEKPGGDSTMGVVSCADRGVPYDIFEGGTMAQPIAADCILSHTAMRAIRLRD